MVAQCWQGVSYDWSIGCKGRMGDKKEEMRSRRNFVLIKMVSIWRMLNIGETIVEKDYSDINMEEHWRA